MNRWRKKFVAICLIYSGIQQSLVATPLTSSEENVRVKFNSDMSAIYGVGEQYYPLKDGSNRELHIYYKDQIRGGGEPKFSHILCYGEPYGKNDGTVNEYLGTTNRGLDVPNPQYGWDSGWDGKPISKWGELEPWKNRWNVDKTYNEKKLNVPGIGMTTLENAIQTGVDLVYGGKTYNQIKGPKAPNCSDGDKSVHTVGAKPTGGWIQYVHVIIPPTQDTWGEGRLYQGSHYMGVPIAPFSLLGPDLSVKVTPESFKPVRNSKTVNVSVTVYSTYKQTESTDYRWTIKGKSGKDYKVNAAVSPTFSGYGTSDSGTAEIPRALSNNSSTNPAVFDLSFKMPEEEVEVSFTINESGKQPEEGNLSNNTVQVIVPWEPYTITTANYYLDYNQLSREIKHKIGSVSGSVSKPKGYWYEGGSLQGSLSITTSENDNALLDINYENDKIENPSFSVGEEEAEGSSTTKDPAMYATIDRSTFGDNPSEVYKVWENPKQPDVRTMVTNYEGNEGELSKPYKWDETETGYRTNADGTKSSYTYIRTYSGTAYGKYSPAGEDTVNIGVYIYNGMKKMAQIAAREFLKEIEDNENDSFNKTIYWESEPYELDVIRWMERVYLDQVNTEATSGSVEVKERKEAEQVDGQYQRTFTQQNKSIVKWNVSKSMPSLYTYDRKNAKNKKKDKASYPRVPFATDRELQGEDYPFKSGYYFNPTGEYTVTITTETYKDKDEPTEEHLALVNRLIEAFKYSSTMSYVDNKGDLEGPLNIEITDIDDSDESDEVTSEDEFLVVEKDTKEPKYFELPHTTDPSGYTHQFFKEILEGYDESETSESKDEYKYREYIKDGQHIYHILEETTITFKVNEENRPRYTWGGMKNGNYHMTAWAKDIDISDITRVPQMILKGINALDHIPITVQGSMYDDLNN